MPESTKPIEIFISYSHKDANLFTELNSYLASLQQLFPISRWSDMELLAGDVWDNEIQKHLNTALIILLLISPDYLESNYVFGVEMVRAMERHEKGQARVIPIILRPTDWVNTPFGKLQALPSFGRPVTRWQNRTEAYQDIVQGIQKVIRDVFKIEPFSTSNSAAIPLPLTSIPARPVISGFTSDDPYGQDLLDIQKEVEILCSVLAAKEVEPPLSLGLFGDWGSGKSFFMRLMQERIELLQKKAENAKGDTAFCKKIVQLKFNAWHYIDTDLWASLTSEIFVGLAKSLFTKQDADSEYKQARLQDEAIKAKGELTKAEQAWKEADKKLQESEKRRQKFEQDEFTLEKKLTPKALIQGTLNVAFQQPEVSNAVKEAKKQLDIDLKQAAKELNFPPNRETDNEVKLQIQDLAGTLGRIRALTIAIRNKKGIFRWQLIVIPVLILLAAFLAVHFKDFFVGLLGAIIAIPVGLIVPAAPLIPGTLRAVKIIKQVKEETTKRIGDAQRQKREEIDQEVNKAREEHQQAEKKLKEANEKVQKKVQEIEEQRADHQIAEFIKQRQASTDYTQYLGVIAKARKDFEQLSFLLAKQKEEAEKRSRTPNNQDNLSPHSIDRIILYIDDLDRCPEKRVVEVLQAIHLLLAFPLFVVVVGVDSRWLMHSLKQHSKAFQTENDGASGDELTQWHTTPYNYMEKIFQIPFTLRPMQAMGFGHLIDVLAYTGLINKNDANGNPVEQKENNALQNNGPDSPENDPAVPNAPNAPAQEDDELNPGYLQIEDREREVMKQLYHFIPSPRAAKRFVNIYRLLKASINGYDPQSFIDDGNGGKYRSMLLLLAMLIGYPDETTEILCTLLEKKPPQPWWSFIDFLNQLKETEEVPPNIVNLPQPPANSMALHTKSRPEVERWQQLSEKLAQVRSLIREDELCQDFVEFAPLVARYSYLSRPVLLAQ